MNENSNQILNSYESSVLFRNLIESIKYFLIYVKVIHITEYFLKY